jgi:hypothetical protein
MGGVCSTNGGSVYSISVRKVEGGDEEIGADRRVKKKDLKEMNTAMNLLSSIQGEEFVDYLLD